MQRNPCCATVPGFPILETRLPWLSMNKRSMGRKWREAGSPSLKLQQAPGPLSKLTCPAQGAHNLKGLVHRGAPSDKVGDNVACLPVSLSAFFSSQRKRTPAEPLIPESIEDLAERLRWRWVPNSDPTVQTDPAGLLCRRGVARSRWSCLPACQPCCFLCDFPVELGGSLKAGQGRSKPICRSLGREEPDLHPEAG